MEYNKYYFRVVFRTFDEHITIRKYGLKTYVLLHLIKLCTIPWNYDDYTYDHVELITHDKCWVSVKLEAPNPFRPKKGVYKLVRNGRDMDIKDVDIQESWKAGRYKLIFIFPVNRAQIDIFNKYILKHLGQPYNGMEVSWNIALRYISKIIKKDLSRFYKNDTSSWNCVKLILHILREMNILPEFDTDGKRIDILSHSSQSMTHLLFDLHKKGLLTTKHIISHELQPLKSYKEDMALFYSISIKAYDDIEEKK